MIRVISFVAVVILISSVSLAGDISGIATAIDGDTIKLAGKKIRIHGIDAPEARQTCKRDDVTWLCGQEAGQRLRTLVDSAEVTCQSIDQDRYSRIVAKCFVAGRDLGEFMVSEGLALAYRHYSSEYVQAEASARAGSRGLWSGQFVEPWEWRRGKRLVATPANDNEACEIKGNISRSGDRIYHVPGGTYYGRTKIDQSKGERMFCSEAEAREAGWRKSSR